MEEDIKKLIGEYQNVDLITLLRTFKKEGLENFIVIRKNKLENLIKGYRELEEDNAELKEESCCMTTCMRKDKEKVFFENKIQKKIEELLKKLDEQNNDRWEKDDDIYYNKIKAQIRILKELLEESNV